MTSKSATIPILLFAKMELVQTHARRISSFVCNSEDNAPPACPQILLEESDTKGFAVMTKLSLKIYIGKNGRQHMIVTIVCG